MAEIQDGRQNGVQNTYLSPKMLILSGTWLVIYPFQGFWGQGIKICQNGLRQGKCNQFCDGIWSPRVKKFKMAAKLASKISI